MLTRAYISGAIGTQERVHLVDGMFIARRYSHVCGKHIILTDLDSGFKLFRVEKGVSQGGAIANMNRTTESIQEKFASLSSIHTDTKS